MTEDTEQKQIDSVSVCPCLVGRHILVKRQTENCPDPGVKSLPLQFNPTRVTVEALTAQHNAALRRRFCFIIENLPLPLPPTRYRREFSSRPESAAFFSPRLRSSQALSFARHFYDWRRATSSSRRRAPRSPRVYTVALEFMEVNEKRRPQCNTKERHRIYVLYSYSFFPLFYGRGEVASWIPAEPLAAVQEHLQVSRTRPGLFPSPCLPLWLYFFLLLLPTPIFPPTPFKKKKKIKACTSKHAAGNTGGVDLTPQTSS